MPVEGIPGKSLEASSRKLSKIQRPLKNTKIWPGNLIQWV